MEIPDYVTDECIPVPKTRYDYLIEAEAMLDALYATGVDNWPGYGEAMEYLEGCKNEEKKV